MRLKELKTACDEYSSLGKSFDEATEIFRLETGPTFEISRHQGRALMTWLNKWGCRQFAKAQHDYALSEFREWAESNQSLCASARQARPKFCTLCALIAARRGINP
jgi:hypothetical protein